ncbi:unnamed protein product, partial [Ilex paraguariensis]
NNPDPLPLYPHPSHNGSAAAHSSDTGSAATPAQQRHTVAINTAATPTAFTKLSPGTSLSPFHDLKWPAQ